MINDDKCIRTVCEESSVGSSWVETPQVCRDSGSLPSTGRIQDPGSRAAGGSCDAGAFAQSCDSGVYKIFQARRMKRGGGRKIEAGGEQRGRLSSMEQSVFVVTHAAGGQIWNEMVASD